MNNIILIFTLGCVVFGDTIDVMEGDSVTLYINLANIDKDDKIQWRFEPEGPNSLLARIDEKNIKYAESVDESFRGRLDLNIQTGDLTIKNTRIKHSGRYEATILRTNTTSVRFNLNINESDVSAGKDEETVLKTEGDSVILHTGVQTQRGDLILWRSGPKGHLIAKYDEDNKRPIYDDEKRFRGRLKLDDQTGSLTISDVRSSDSGLYKLKISSNNRQTLEKTFSVSVSGGGGLSKGVITVIVVCVLVAVAVVAAVIYYRRKISNQEVEEIVEEEGKSVTLPTGVTKLQSNHEIEWRFGKEIIAKIKKNEGHILCDVDERFTNRLNLNTDTGNLMIRRIKTKHTGLYNLKITSRTGTSNSQFNVIVYARNRPTRLGEDVTLKAELLYKEEVEEILWTFGADDIRIARFIKEDSGPIKYYDYKDEDCRFKDKLKLDPVSGDLTIRAITREHSGVYRLHIFSTNGTEYWDFNLSILLQAEVGTSFTLETGVEMQNGDEVQWSSPPQKITLASGTIGDKHSITYTADVALRGRLEMNPQNGNLTISDVKETDFKEYTFQQYRTVEGNGRGTKRRYMLKNIKVKLPGKNLKQKQGWIGNQTAPDEGQPLTNV